MTVKTGAGPVIYEVTVTARPEIAPAFEEYLRDRHIAEVVATGCFTAAILSGGGGRYRVGYRAPSGEALARYHRDHADHLRADAVARFPEGVTVEREEWPVIVEVGPGKLSGPEAVPRITP